MQRVLYAAISLILFVVGAQITWGQEDSLSSDSIAPVPTTVQENLTNTTPTQSASSFNSRPPSQPPQAADSLFATFDSARADSVPAIVQPVEPLIIEITKSPSKVLAIRSPESPMLGLVYKGETYEVVLMGESWCKIKYKDTVGWIEQTSVRSYHPTKANAILKKLPLYILAGLAGILVLVFLLMGISALFRKIFGSASAQVSIPVGKTCLIISSQSTRVGTAFSEATMPLEQCFSEIGFAVSNAVDFSTARNLMMQYVPNVMCIDWRVDPDPMQLVERLLLGKSTAPVIVFYNVGDSTGAQAHSTIKAAHFLGVNISDRDIFKFVTPIILQNRMPQSSIEGAEIHALEGEITPGSLMELLQFLEIGHKSGCLLIEKNGPDGMLYLQDGQVVYATTQNFVSQEAVLAMLGMQSGRFRLILDKKPPSVNVTQSTLEILMAWTKASDEASKH